MCNKGGDAPTPDPLIGQAARLNAETAKEALAWYKDLYTNELAPMQKEQQELARNLIDKYIASMDKQSQFADEQKAYYDQTFKPIEQQMARDAMDYDSQANIDRRSGIAAANVAQQFSNAAQENARTLSRYGLNPNSSAFAATNERLMREKALQTAGAQTGAAFDTMDRGIALRAGAANFGRNMPNTAATYYGNSNNAGGQAMGTSGAAMDGVRANANTMGQGYQNFFQGNTSAGNLMLGDFQGRMQGYEADQRAQGAMWQGIGSMVGLAGGSFMGTPMGKRLFAADGGEIHEGAGGVRGPGGPVDDKIPAMLSNGEYVLPADTVKRIGVKKLDKLVAETHTPAAIQRRKAGLKRKK